METQNRHRRIRYPLAVAGFILVAFLLDVGVAQVVDALASGSASWLPQFGTIGQTVVIYESGVALFELVIIPVAAFWLGTKYGADSA